MTAINEESAKKVAAQVTDALLEFCRAMRGIDQASLENTEGRAQVEAAVLTAITPLLETMENKIDEAVDDILEIAAKGLAAHPVMTGSMVAEFLRSIKANPERRPPV